MVKITVTFDTWEELEVFRVSGKKTRSKKEEAEEAAALEPAQAAPVPQQTFTPPPVGVVAQPSHGFPGGNSSTPPVAAATHPLVTAILARIDGAVASGQSSDAVVTWFRQQIGPDAAQATLDQIKQVFVPRMSETQLKQIAPQLGIVG